LIPELFDSDGSIHSPLFYSRDDNSAIPSKRVDESSLSLATGDDFKSPTSTSRGE